MTLRKTPGTKMFQDTDGRSKEDGHSVADAFAPEARAVNEAYLLQRDVHIIHEGTA